MNQALGAKGKLLLAFETTFGTTPDTPAAVSMPFDSFGLTAKQALVEPNTITGRRDPVRPGRGNIDPSGNIVVPLDVRYFGYWLKAMFGAPTTTDVSTAGSLTGATGVTTTIGTWTAVADGAFKISIDGSAVTAVGPIDFSGGVTTMANVASKIQAAIRAIATGGFTNATVVWDEANTRFIITSGTTGASSAVSNLTAPASGTNIAGAGFMKCTAGTLANGVTKYQHIFKVGDTMPSMVLENGFTDINVYALLNGCKVSGFSTSFALNNSALTASLDLMAAKETIGSATIDDSPTTHSLLRFDNFQAAVKEGGSTIGNCTRLDLSINFGLDGETFALAYGGFRGAINEGMIQPTGSIEAFFENATLLNKAVEGTESSIEVTLTNGNHSLSFEFPEIIFERQTPGIEGPGGVKITLPFRGYYDDNAGNSSVIVTLVNDVASYA